MISLRKCIGCGGRDIKENLIRIAKSPKKLDKIDISVCDGYAEGRGAYLCNSGDCLKKARKGRKLERTFSCKVNPEVYDKLESMVKDSE